MKKLFLGLVILGALILAAPNTAKAESDCVTTIITCNDGSQHTVMCCDKNDYTVWCELKCNDNCQE